MAAAAVSFSEAVILKLSPYFLVLVLLPSPVAQCPLSDRRGGIIVLCRAEHSATTYPQHLELTSLYHKEKFLS